MGKRNIERTQTTGAVEVVKFTIDVSLMMTNRR
jgi:hypothetical protein